MTGDYTISRRILLLEIRLGSGPFVVGPDFRPGFWGWAGIPATFVAGIAAFLRLLE
ncbi:MAG TPA: hypothetical protein VMX16_06655 [Terriglobia bacterium]|nr:hypothetical protein [Terriglobia bacterium]